MLYYNYNTTASMSAAQINGTGNILQFNVRANIVIYSFEVFHYIIDSTNAYISNSNLYIRIFRSGGLQYVGDMIPNSPSSTFFLTSNNANNRNKIKTHITIGSNEQLLISYGINLTSGLVNSATLNLSVQIGYKLE